MQDDERIKRLWDWAFGDGSGSRGADSRLDIVEEKLDTVHETLHQLDQAERMRAREEHADRKARRAFGWGISVTLFVMAVGGIRFAVWLTEQVTQISRLLSPMGGP